MSKAKDWADHHHKRPMFSVNNSAVCVVNDSGSLSWASFPPSTIGPEDALRFADWLYEMFSEPVDEKCK